MFETGKAAGEVDRGGGIFADQRYGGNREDRACDCGEECGERGEISRGNEGVFKFFVGQVMRETRGQANPQAVNDILKRILSEG